MLGDSMTGGDELNPAGFRSYRGTLYNLLVADGLNVDFLGVRSEHPAVGGDADFSAWGGMWIGPGGNAHNVWNRLPETLPASANPDVIVLSLGWNSVMQVPALVAAKYTNLVNKVASLKPNAQIIVATLSPLRGQTEQQTSTSWTGAGYTALNRRARELGTASATDNVHLADLARMNYEFNDFFDDVHWSQRVVTRPLVRSTTPSATAP